LDLARAARERPKLQSYTIQQILGEEARELRSFLTLLEREQRALTNGDAEALMPLADEKNRLTERLHSLGQQRAEWFVAHGYGGDHNAIGAWLQRTSQDGSTSGNWQQVLDLATRARTINEENGTLIRMRMQHNQRALAILLAASNRAALYGPDGQTRGAAEKRHIGSV
jgi:flagellar biosynthesis protein FlgN